MQISTGECNERGKHGIVSIEETPDPVQGWDIRKWCCKDDTGT